jgi:CDP-diacylglycerol--serine O-phosphatidyltransferase
MVAAVVYAAGGTPIGWWPLTGAWLCLLALLSFLMVSTWRYRSFKDLQLLRPRSWLIVVLSGSVIYLIWTYPEPALLGLACVYVGSGIAVRLGGVLRRQFRPRPPEPEHQAG